VSQFVFLQLLSAVGRRIASHLDLELRVVKAQMDEGHYRYRLQEGHAVHNKSYNQDSEWE
jgi:hypothetical protein